MVKNGITKLSVSVLDMEKSLEFYVGCFGCEVVGGHSYTNAELKAAWGVEDGVTGEAKYLRKGTDRPTLLELIRFSPLPAAFKRPEGQPNYYCGTFDIGFRVKDMPVQYELLKDRYRFFNPPKAYTAPWTSNEVQEVVMWSPDRVPTAFMMSGVNEGSGFTSITTNAYFTRDVDAANKFFTDVLGLNVVFDRVMPEGLVNNILDIPAGDTPRITMIFRQGINSPVPEIMECQHDVPAVNDYAKPQDIGIIGAAYEVENLDETVAAAAKLGYETVAPAFEMENGPLGKLRAATVRAFDGEFFQLYQVV
jgi:catechol 2,3-dioxygenase-like lactoylglutathione lyase family enzyme